ncbi:hypothetical protein BJ322DRAFT_1020220 [Thelephora terrestris]|uniref:Transmembrane protein n=1 Tax=Thelephora terrestris TaxID=56493 RepID=A0A9P6HG45_9AGAM|nr:hypothetical protein BJ322DRAFT_1020220 [Thelephora terrestris]
MALSMPSNSRTSHQKYKPPRFRHQYPILSLYHPQPYASTDVRSFTPDSGSGGINKGGPLPLTILSVVASAHVLAVAIVMCWDVRKLGRDTPALLPDTECGGMLLIARGSCAFVRIARRVTCHLLL